MHQEPVSNSLAVDPRQDSGRAEEGTPAVSRLLSRIFSFPVFLSVLLLGGLFLYMYTSLQKLNRSHDRNTPAWFVEGDTWMHLAIGRQILTTGHFPEKDTFSYTAYGSPNLAYEWLGEVMMAAGQEYAGLRGLIGVWLLWAAALLVMIFYYAYDSSGNPTAAFVTACLAFPIAAWSHLRPAWLGYAFLAFTLIALERFRQGRRAMLWTLPAVFLIWVNIHATFVFGLFFLALYWASGLVSFHWGSLVARAWTVRERLQLVTVGLLSALAICITPYGARLAATPITILSQSHLGTKVINEYKPLTDYPPLVVPFLIVLLIFILLQIVTRPTVRLEQIAMLGFSTVLAAVHVRFLILFSVIFAPFAAALLARLFPWSSGRQNRWVLNASLIGLIFLAMFELFPRNDYLPKVLYAGFPRGAVQYLNQHPVAGHLINGDAWGGFLDWSWGPTHRVFIDGRSDIYEEQGVFLDHLHITRLHRDALALLRKYDIQACLVQRGSALDTLLKTVPEWRLVYHDDVSVLFEYDPHGRDMGSGGNRALDAVSHSDESLLSLSRQ